MAHTRSAALRHFFQRVLRADRVDLLVAVDLDSVVFSVVLLAGFRGDGSAVVRFDAFRVVAVVRSDGLHRRRRFALVGLGFGDFALFGFDQRLPVGDRDLVVVGMDFRERQKAVAVAAVVDKGGLQRRLDAGDLG